MLPSRNISTGEILLQVLELTSLGALDRASLLKKLRRKFPVMRIESRLDGMLAGLAAEKMLEVIEVEGASQYSTTQLGLATLEQNGRYTATATVLFTDIVDSTAMIGRVGESQAHAIRQRHFALLRSAIAEFDGREVKNLGDGLMVVFSRPADALSCAAEMRRRVEEDADQVGMRIGVHCGELLRDGNDYFGSTVIVASRLCDSAGAGQTIVSEATYANVDAEVDAALENLGAIQLKGIGEPVRVAAFA